MSYEPAHSAIPKPKPFAINATVSLVYGVAGLVLLPINDLAAAGIALCTVLNGHAALADYKNGHREGRRRATAGLFLGYVGLALAAAFKLWSVTR